MQGHPPRIWTVCYLYPPSYSGAGFQAHREHVKFMERGFPVFVLAAASNERLTGGRTEQLDGITVHYFPAISVPVFSFPSRFRILHKLWEYLLEKCRMFVFAFQTGWMLLRYGHRGDFVRIEIPNTFTFLPLLAARVKGIHSILRMHMVGSDDPASVLARARRGQFPEYLTLFAFHLSDVVVGICSAMMDSSRQVNLSESKLKLIQHGIDVTLYHPINSMERAGLCGKLNLDPNKRYVIFVGVPLIRKGIDIVIDAYIELRKTIHDVELLIVGPYKNGDGTILGETTMSDKMKVIEDCKVKIAQANCNEYVHWIGRVDNVQEYMQVSSLFCFPTRKEGLPLVVAEAMASGLPVVLSRLDGITTDFVESAEGVIVTGFCAEDYTEEMMNILVHSDRSLQMGTAARERAEAMFNLDHTIEKWIMLFNELQRNSD